MLGNENAQLRCQVQEIRCASALIPSGLARVYQLRGHLRRRGAAATCRKMFQWTFGSWFARNAAQPPETRACVEEVLSLKPGEWVETRSYEEIRGTLDANGRNRGLLFMPDMAEYCGRRFQVYKPIARILLEDTGELRRMKNTVLLEGVMCRGLNVGCDRSCFHFWREAWLRCVDGNQPGCASARLP